MTDAERDALIGRAVQEHKTLRQTLVCLEAKADQMQKAVADGLRLIKPNLMVWMHTRRHRNVPR